MAARIPAARIEALVAAALAARARAYAPYSRYRVGAAVLTGGGAIVSGCNVENASFGLCLCAERNAITTAVAMGERELVAMAVATRGEPPAPPCGPCRQFAAEFAVDMPIILVNHKGDRVRTRLARLLPSPFRWKGAGT